MLYYPFTVRIFDAFRNSKTAVDAWSQAVLDYTDSLSPSQQLKIRAPATSDDCVRILKEHRSRKKAFTRILQILEPFIHTLKRLEGAIDVVVQVNAGIASPVWGPVRLAVDVRDHLTRSLLALMDESLTKS